MTHGRKPTEGSVELPSYHRDALIPRQAQFWQERANESASAADRRFAEGQRRLWARLEKGDLRCRK